MRRTRRYRWVIAVGKWRYYLIANGFGHAVAILFRRLRRRKPPHDGEGGWRGVSGECLGPD